MKVDVPAQCWEGASADELRAAWEVPAVLLFRSVASTNDVARDLAASGAPDGTVILGDEQTAGRGQRGRVWTSPPGLGVWLSAIVRPRAATNPALLPLAVGVALAEQLERFVAPATVTVKWPNDLLVGGRKLGGILCEAAWDGDAPSYVIVGAGINVLHTRHHFPPELQPTATSLAMHSGGGVSRRAVAGAVVRGILAGVRSCTGLLAPPMLESLQRRDALAGRRIHVVGAGEYDGAATAIGIAPDGSLLVRSPAGALRRVNRGSVRLDPEAPA